MDKLGRGHEAIQMCQRRYNYFPLVFRWHGSLFRVRSVERCWAQGSRLPLHGVARRLWFRVRAAADGLPDGGRPGSEWPSHRRPGSEWPSHRRPGSEWPSRLWPAESRLEVYQDLAANTWHVGRVASVTTTGEGAASRTVYVPEERARTAD